MKNGTEVTVNKLSNFHQMMLVILMMRITFQIVSKLWKDFTNVSSVSIKLSKNQSYKIGQNM